jgi:predicted transglutaminase-like cysteine proteinase
MAMSKLVRRLGVVSLILALGVCLWQMRVEAGGLAAPVQVTTTVPYGWADFCRRYAGECDGPQLPAQDIQLTSGARGQIERINRQVNAAIQPVTDPDHWGLEDQWDYPLDGKGDCEDYALLKRKLLMVAGLPRQALLMTVVRDRHGEGHAVLTVKTDRGDYVLDNLSDAILPTADTGYRFVKRQSQEDPNVWVPLGNPGPSPLYTAR